MRALGCSPVVRSRLLLMMSLFMLVGAVYIYVDDSRDMQNMLIKGGSIMIAVGLFWLVGGVPVGRRELNDERSWIRALFLAAFALIMVALMIGRYLAPTDSSTEVLLRFGWDLMMAGAASWLSILYTLSQRK